jgi:hypothetical protein
MSKCSGFLLKRELFLISPCKAGFTNNNDKKLFNFRRKIFTIMNEKEKKTKPLVAKVIGGIAFLALFILNIMVFVKKDSKTGNISLTSLQAYADGENGGGTNHTYSTTLLDPPNGSVSINFNGGQLCTITVKNNDVLGVITGVKCNYSNPFNSTWQATLLPLQSASKVYSVFGTVPLGYKFTVSDLDDPCNVGIFLSSNY